MNFRAKFRAKTVSGDMQSTYGVQSMEWEALGYRAQDEIPLTETRK